jgi:predicted nucleotidyltransferase
MTEVERIKEKTTPILKKYGFKKVGLFGSRARGDFRPESDIDLLFSREDSTDYFNKFRVQEELKDSLGVDVDLVDDTRVVARMRPQIKKDLKIIYEK